MAVWLVRAGSHGEYEQKFVQDKRIYVTWDDLNVDLSQLFQRNELITYMAATYPDAKVKTVQNWSSQVWPFAHEMKQGDLVVVPLKTQSSVYVGEISSAYQYEPNGPNPFFHWRSVKWIGESIQRSSFAQDLLYSFGAFMTICRIQRNQAEQRISAMRAANWKPETIGSVVKLDPVAGESAEDTDLEQLARDQIRRLIETRFKGHHLTRLVEGLLKAQGYTTYRSPDGADGGSDILAGLGPLGFGRPRLCVEVKSETGTIDRPTVDKLLGAVSKFGADEGLFVSWSGFKGTVAKELATSFFRVRLWTAQDLLEQIFSHYEKFDEDLKAELPLKRVWTLAAQDDDLI